MASTQELKNFIDGRWVAASTGETFENIDPATGELIANVAKSSTADVDRAIEAARRALDGWRLFPAPKRGEILYRAGEIMLRRKDELAREMTREMGKVLPEARGDVQEGIDMTYYMGGEGRRQFGDVVPAELPNKWAMAMRGPVGVVAAITPWNFPFAIPTWKIMPALVLGNAVVFKPASYTPMLAVRLVEILEEAGLPKGVLNLILGPGGELGDHLISHPAVDLISFTGSSDTGSHISEIGGRLLKRVSCELGGKNAIVVLEDADVDLSLDGIVWSAFGTSGQRCTAASRVIAQTGVAQGLIDKLVGRAKKLRLGSGLDPHAQCEQRVPLHARCRNRARLHQRRHHRRGDPAPVRRHEVHRQRPPRGRARRARCLLGVEIDLRGLFREAPASADGYDGDRQDRSVAIRSRSRWA